MTRLPFVTGAHVRAAATAVAEMKAHSGAALLPTETFYGLAVDPADAAAVGEVLRLKGRPRGWPCRCWPRTGNRWRRW